jgi:hypothetical protein
MQPNELILFCVIQKFVDVFEEIHPSPLQTFRVGLTFTGIILSTLYSNLGQLGPSSLKNY